MRRFPFSLISGLLSVVLFLGLNGSPAFADHRDANGEFILHEGPDPGENDTVSDDQTAAETGVDNRLGDAVAGADDIEKIRAELLNELYAALGMVEKSKTVRADDPEFQILVSGMQTRVLKTKVFLNDAGPLPESQKKDPNAPVINALNALVKAMEDLAGVGKNQPGTKTENPTDTTKPTLIIDPNQGDASDIALNGVADGLIEARPKHPDGYQMKGRYNYRDRNYNGAYNNYHKAIELGARDSKTYAGYAGAAHNLGDFQLAAKSAALALGMDPNNMSAFSTLKLSEGRVSATNLPSALDGPGGGGGMNIASLGPAPAAQVPPSRQIYPPRYETMTPAEIAAEAQAQAKAPPTKIKQSKVLTRQVATALTVKDYTRAHEIATRAIELNPKNAQAWNYRAIANNKLHRWPDAIKDASYSLGLVPGNAPALQSRGWAFNKQAQYNKGLADANHTLEGDPLNAFAYQNRAFGFAGLRQNPAAITALKRSAELASQFKPRYEKALQVPEDGDLLFLFDDKPVEKTARGPVPLSPAQKKKKFMRLLFVVLSGGVLVALGLIHIVTGSLSQTVRNTVRRALGSSPAPAAEAVAVEEGGEDSGFAGSQYELLKEIGSGGMGIVYEGRDKSLNRPVAVKKMRDEIRLDTRERERFLTEARTVAVMHHPNIVDIYSILEDSGEIYLVFEFVKGKTLAQILEEKKTIPYDSARGILKNACDAVDYAHKQKIIHRDLKPSNIIINDEGVAKVMDFGVARQAKDALTKQRTNTVVGTPPYMAPEQEQGTVMPESDVYSLGICFYEMLSGKLPFQGLGAGMLLNKMNGKYTPISEAVGNGLPQGLDQVFAKAFSPDPQKRYKAPGDFYRALEALDGTGPV